MDTAMQLRERNRAIRAFAVWQESAWYPIVYALLCAISGLFGKEVYIPIALIITVFIVFSAFFTHDLKTLITPFFMTFYMVGIDNPEHLTSTREQPLGVFDMPAFIFVLFLGVIMFSAVCYRLIKSGIIRDLTHRPRLFLYGILALNAAYLLNGAFSGRWDLMALVNGVLYSLGLTVTYVIFSHIILNQKGSLTNYICLCMVCSAAAVVLQTSVVMLRLHEADKLFHLVTSKKPPVIQRHYIQLAWGYVTNMAGIIITGIPAALYLASRCRFSLLSYLLAFVFCASAYATATRNAMLFGSIMLVVCLILACAKGKNRVLVRYYTLITFLATVLALIYIDKNISSLRESILPGLQYVMRLEPEELVENLRWELWKNGIQDFLASPIFGVGFSDGGRAVKDELSNTFHNMYHNILIEFIGAMGIVGALAFLWHIKDVCRVLFTRFSSSRTLLMMVPVAILLTSLLDNFFFYFNFQIFYTAFLALAERDLIESASLSKPAIKNI